MANNKADHESKKLSHQSAREIINTFFADLQNLDRMDPGVANIIQVLWNEKKLGRDELLSALNEARKKRGVDFHEKD